VAAALRKALGITARIVDANADGLSIDDLREIIKAETPDLIGFSVLTFNLLNCMEVSRAIREVSPGTKICYGGWHPTLYPEETLRLNFVDYIVIGEGEVTFPELVSYCMKNMNFGDAPCGIRGIGYKTPSGDIRINPPRELLKDLDSLPFPAYDLIQIQKYSNLLACTENSINIMTSRGCPQRCIFCDLRCTPYRSRSPLNILEEIRYWVDKGVREFFIQDDNFTINRKRTIEFCRLLNGLRPRIKYKISSRVDYLDDELLGHLKKSGCYRIYFGVESGSQQILDYLEKGITIKQIKDAFKLSRKHGIDRFAYIMIGAPAESRDDIAATLRLISEIKPEHLHCSICTPMPRTNFYQKLLSEGLISGDYWRGFAENPDPNFKTPFCSRFFNAEELRDMQNSIQRKFYLNPRIVFQEIIKTRGLKQFAAKTKLAFNFFSTK
jgi:radical SAM superfamily enzyme YgiQ (UPF0313 family)